MSDYNFYRDGGNGETRVSVASPYMPAVMRQLATTLITEYDPVTEVNALVKRPQRWIDDTPVDAMTASINDELHQLIAREEDRAFATGTRCDEPQGLFTSTAYERVTGSLSSDALISFVHMVGVHYRAKASWLAHPRTVLDLLRLHDGRFIYQSPPCRGVPGRLFDWPLFEDEHVPERQLAFGNFPEGYQITSSPETIITRDPFRAKPMVIFHAKRHVGGAPRTPEAIKVFSYDNDH